MTEDNFEKGEQEERIYKERLLYAGELTKRIASVLNACENYQPAYEPLMNLRAFLLPQIKNDVSAQTTGLRAAFNKFIARLPQPVLNIPTQARRPNNEYGYGTPPQNESSMCFMGPHTKEKKMCWSDFPAAVREMLQNYFVPGQCVQSTQVQSLAFYVFARAEIEQIIKSADAHGLLLITGASVTHGGMSLYDPGDEQE